MSQRHTNIRYYLKEILSNSENLREFKKIFAESHSYEECIAKLHEFREKHQKIVGDVSNTKFILSCYTWARQQDVDLSLVDGSRKAKIFKESKRVQEVFKKTWLAKDTVAEILEKMAAAGGKHVTGMHDLWNSAIALGLPRRGEIARKQEEDLQPPKFDELTQLPNPLVLQVKKEDWEKPGVPVGAHSRWDWKGKGARTGIIRALMHCAVEAGCKYNVLNGGLVDKKYVAVRIDAELALHDRKVSKKFKDLIIDRVLDEIAEELRSVIPIIKKPTSVLRKGDIKYVRLYIIISPILDGPYGQRVAQKLENLRKDIRVYKEGGDRTRLKGIISNAEERERGGQEIEWLNPRKHRLPGQYISTPVDKEITEQLAAGDDLPSFIVVAGHGSSMSKPGGGEKDIPYISLPMGSAPFSRLPGEPSIALNQIGMRVIHALPDGKRRRISTWSVRDLIRDEREFVTGIKTGATELQRKIVEAIKKDRHGLHIGELHDVLNVDRSTLERALNNLLEPKASRRTTWPGLYKDAESGRYNFHRDWFQERLEYPWPYGKGYLELRRLLFGFLHAGYNVTDYEYVRWRFPKIINELQVDVLELVGDIVAGLKHHLVHRGQIIGNMNYTEQEVLAAELLGSVIFDVFVERMESRIKGLKEFSSGQVEMLMKQCLITFIYIVGNHDTWQRELGITPAVTFRLKLYLLLTHHIKNYLLSKQIPCTNLESIIESKIIELPENDARYTYEGGLTKELWHPGMARAETVSARAEQALRASDAHLVDLANFHTTIEVEKWHPTIGQRIATQAGTMVIYTDFEHSKMKIVDFGAVFVKVRYLPANTERNARIFYSEHEFFSEPILKTPYSKDTNINELKRELKLLKSPI